MSWDKVRQNAQATHALAMASGENGQFDGAAAAKLARAFEDNGLDVARASRMAAQSGTFFYADPPYWQTAGYGSTFEWAEYERLAEAMRTMQGKMMLSINDHSDIRALFAGFNLRELQLSYSVGRRAQSRTPKGELVICNY